MIKYWSVKKKLLVFGGGLLVIAGIVFSVYSFLNKEDAADNENIGEIAKLGLEPLDINSFLFRDGVLGQEKDAVLESLNLDENTSYEESMFGVRFTTSLVFEDNKLAAMISTAHPEELNDMGAARRHQTISDEMIKSTTVAPQASSEIWFDGYPKAYSNAVWNDALKKNALVLFDVTYTYQGLLVLITDANIYDSELVRPINETTFNTIIVCTMAYAEANKLPNLEESKANWDQTPFDYTAEPTPAPAPAPDSAGDELLPEDGSDEEATDDFGGFKIDTNADDEAEDAANDGGEEDGTTP